MQRCTGRAHLRQQHTDDVFGAIVAEKLAERLFVPGNTVAVDHGDEIGGRETGKRRLAEMRVGGEEILRAGMDIGEIAAAAA